MSPSFSPDGVLYVRDADGSAYTLIDGKAKQVWKAPKDEEGEDDDPYDVDGPPPVKWKDGKPDFAPSFGPDDIP